MLRIMRNKKICCGFTLIELLVVISIIALLLSIMLPSLNKAKEKARSAVCKSNLKQLGAAFEMYTMENKGYMPVAWDVKVGTTLANNWMPFVSRYLGEGKPKDDFWDYEARVWNCPSYKPDPAWPEYMNYVYSYAMNVHLSFAFSPPDSAPPMMYWQPNTFPDVSRLRKSQIQSPLQKVLLSDGAGWSVAFDHLGMFGLVAVPRALRHSGNVNTLMAGLNVSNDTVDFESSYLQFKKYPNLYAWGPWRH